MTTYTDLQDACEAALTDLVHEASPAPDNTLHSLLVAVIAHCEAQATTPCPYCGYSQTDLAQHIETVHNTGDGRTMTDHGTTTTHQLRTDERLGHGETKKRDWYCTCGKWRTHDYDTHARRLFAAHRSGTR